MIEILDENLRKIDVLRKYTFAQYTNKFRDIGTFTIDAKVTEENMYLVDDEKEFYVLFDGIIFGKILKITRDSNSEYEKVIKIQGKLSNRFFEQRVIVGTRKFTKQTHENIFDILKEYRESKEELGWLSIEPLYEDEERLKEVCTKVETQITGGDFWEAMKQFLDQDYLGVYFVPIVKPEHEYQFGILDPVMTNISQWKLYISAGVDRTKGNKYGNTPVVFSQALSNIEGTVLEIDNENYKTIAYVAGEGESSGRTWIQAYAPNIGVKEQVLPWSRNELFVDARDLQSKNENGDTMTQEEYMELLKKRGEEKFAENSKEKTYSATVIQANKQYVYLKDYKLGDWVTVLDKELGIEVNAQITEITKSIEGNSEIIDLGITYGNVKTDVVEQVKEMKKTLKTQESNIQYIENKSADYKRLGLYYGASGQAKSVYGSICNPCSLRLPKGVYLVFGMTDLTIGGVTVNDIMSLGFKNTGNFVVGAGGREVRTTAIGGGGLVNWQIINCKEETTVALQCYGYMNKTYNYRGWMSAVIIR